MTPNAPQPPIPEPDAACDPHRGKPTRKRGLQHTIHYVTPSSKNRELWLRKPWEKRAGWILIHPARPGQQSGDHFDARRAPSARASSFAHAIDG